MFGREPQTRGEKEAMERREKRIRRTEAAETSKQVILDASEAVLTRISQIPLVFCVFHSLYVQPIYMRKKKRKP